VLNLGCLVGLEGVGIVADVELMMLDVGGWCQSLVMPWEEDAFIGRSCSSKMMCGMCGRLR
jgi:hypothetical protein